MATKLFLFFAPLFSEYVVESNIDYESNCGKLNIEYHENNKRTTELDEFPWMARIRYTNNEAELDDIIKGECSAVLISNLHLLTTAHCHGTIDKKPLSVVLGDWDSTNSIKNTDCQHENKCAPIPREYKIKEFIVHPDFEMTKLKNDIAIIQLEEAVEFSDYIQPVCLRSSNFSSSYDGQELLNVGWSRKNYNYKTKEVIQIINKTDCGNFYKKILENDEKLSESESVICGRCLDNADILCGAGLMGTFTSKSGSLHYNLIGLVATGTRKCDLQNPIMIETVDNYYDWIQNLIN